MDLATIQGYDTAECCTGRLYYSVMILRMYTIDSIAICFVDDDSATSSWNNWLRSNAKLLDDWVLG
jgi:hypothetical protein